MRRSTLLASGGLVLLVVVTYLPVLDASFITDDDINVTVNPTLYSAAGLRDMWFVPTSAQQYYPVTYSTFWLERRLWGLDPRGYHVTNVLCHAASVVLLWRLLVFLRVPGAWLAAALFAVHPVEVESVAWVTERRNVLSLALALGSILCFLRFAPPEPDAGQRPSSERKWYAASLVLFAAALLSKTVVVTLPAVLLVIYWWRNGGLTARDVVRTAPFFALALALGSITLWLETNHVGAQGDEWSLTFAERILVAGRAIWFYAGKIVWPYPTLFFYPHWTIDPAAWWQWLYPLAAVVMPVIFWLARKKVGLGPLAGVLIYVGVLMPTLGFMNVYFHIFSFVADHFQYHASPALIALAASGAVTLCRRAGLDSPARPFAAALGRAAAAGLLLILGVLSFRAAGHYQNEETLYRYTIAKNPGSWCAWSNLGMALGEQGRFDEAVDDLRHALDLASEKARVQFNYAKLLIDRGERNGFRPGATAEALAHFRTAAELQPGWAMPEVGIGVALLRENRPDEAQEHLERGLALDPRNADALCALGLLFSERRDLPRAQQHFDRAVALAPELPEVHYGLGRMLAEQGELRPAAAEFAEAVRLRPDYAAAWNNRAVVHARLGEIDQAIACFREVIRLEPDSPAARENLDKALQWQRQTPPR